MHEKLINIIYNRKPDNFTKLTGITLPNSQDLDLIPGLLYSKFSFSWAEMLLTPSPWKDGYTPLQCAI